MSKMSAPQMSVIRFNESDVIVASIGGKTLRITGVGDGIPQNATYALGNGDSFNSYLLSYEPDMVLTSINSYLGEELTNPDLIILSVLKENGKYSSTRLVNIFPSEYDRRQGDVDNAFYSERTYVWNSSTSRFVSQ